jgi:hypothetical protein
VNLPAGESTLDASQALAFVRQRHGLPDGDLDREIRQQYFLSIEAQHILSAGTLLNPVKLHNVLAAVSSSIETDPDLNLPDLAAQVKGFAGHLSSATIPISGTPTIRVNGAAVSIVQVNMDAMPAFIAQIVHGAATNTAAPGPSPAQISLVVMNGGAPTGAAGAASAALHGAGFITGVPTDTTAQVTTTVNYPSEDAAAAAVVVRYLPGATLKLVPGSTGIQVMLGRDGVVANVAAGKAPPPAPPSTAHPATSYTSGSCVN